MSLEGINLRILWSVLAKTHNIMDEKKMNVELGRPRCYSVFIMKE